MRFRLSLSSLRLTSRLASLVFLPVVFLAACQEAPPSDPLTWPDAEHTHRPWTRWWWPGSAVDTLNLTHVLETYRAAGLGGVEITPIYGVRGEEDRFIDFLSPTWMEMLAHTAREAERLDLGVDMATGTGWPFGGPHVTPEHAARRMQEEIHTLTEGESITIPSQRPNEQTGRDAPLIALMAYGSDGQTLDLTQQALANDAFTWTAPEGGWTVIALYLGWTNQQVKRAAPGGEGLVINHFSRAAFDHYVTRFDSAFAPYDDGLVRAFFNDSFEAYGSNWTDGLVNEFGRRHGYDLRHHLPALLRADTVAIDTIRRVTADYQQTMADLLLGAFTEPWVAWARTHGSITRNQAHGSPGNLIDLYAAVDIPETETFGPDQFDIPGYRFNPKYYDNPHQTEPLVLQFPSSAAHLTGKRLISAETGTWLDEHFQVSLSQLKPTVDKLFASGVNHIVYHGTPYSPPDAPWPGWLFYASTHVGPTNTLWRDLPALNAYIARSQSILQSGQADADVLLYYPVHDARYDADRSFFQFTVHNPDEWFLGTPLHEAASYLRERGYAFDYISDQLLEDVRPEENGNGLTIDEASYRVIVVPETRFMPVETLDHLIDLAGAGATILVHRALPGDVPGFGDLADRRAALQEQLERVASVDSTSSEGIHIATLDRGRVLVGDDLGRLLDVSGVPREPIVDQGVTFVRRRHDAGYHYFLTNFSAEPVDGWIPLGVAATSAALLDPMTGEAGRAAVRTGADDRTDLYLQLAPGQSIIVRTYDTASLDGITPRPYALPSGDAIPLNGPWDLTFLPDGEQETPPDATLESLRSWTTLGPAAASFAGTARYTLRFDKPAVEADAWRLDLGRVAESARVRLNGDSVGTAFSLPFTLRLDALQDETNTLEIEVTNLPANRIADLDRRGVTWRRFYDINIVTLDYRPFDASGWEPMESGLIGPVRLVPLQHIDPGE